MDNPFRFWFVGDITIVSIEYNTLMQFMPQLPDLQYRLNYIYRTAFDNGDLPEFWVGNKAFLLMTINMGGVDNPEFFTTSDVEKIVSFAVVSVDDNYGGELWNVASDPNYNGHVKVMLENFLENTDLTNIVLYVDYENFYWSKVISLYLSLGFGDPEDVDGHRYIIGRKYLKLSWPSNNNDFDLCNELRNNYWRGLGYKVNTLYIPIERLEFLGSIAQKQTREYGGGIGVISDDSVYRFSNLEDIHIGTYIDGDWGYVSINKPFVYSFHTHTSYLARDRDPDFIPPSNHDLKAIYFMSKNGLYKHFVICSQKVGGIWSIQMNPHFLLFYVEGLENYIFNYVGSLTDSIFSSDITKNIKINLYLEGIKNLKYNGIRIFDIEYIRWVDLEYLEDYIDYTILPMSANKGILLEKGLLFNFDTNNLRKIMNAIDDSGHSGDQWEHKPLFPLLERANKTSVDLVVQDIKERSLYFSGKEFVDPYRDMKLD